MNNNLVKAFNFFKDVNRKRGAFPSRVLNWQLIGKFSPALIKIIGVKNVQRICDKRHEITINYLKEEFSDFLNNYDFSTDSKHNSKIIWSLWFQDYKNAPEIVKKALDIMRDYAHQKKYDFILLNKDNFQKYVDIPEYILDKLNKNLISYANFSDILRVALLAKHGGVWIDSTVLIRKDFPVYWLELPLFSLKTGKYEDYSPNIAKNRWKTFLLSGNSALFSFTRDFFFEYFKKYDQTIDYLLIDYIFSIAYIINKDIREQIDTIPIANKNLFKLERLLGEQYDKNVWENLTKDTYVFKTTYKLNKDVLLSNGTYYRHLLDK